MGPTVSSWWLSLTVVSGAYSDFTTLVSPEFSIKQTGSSSGACIIVWSLMLRLRETTLT